MTACGNTCLWTGSTIESKWPAAAVIPAPIAYIKVVAVKKFVVEFLSAAAVRLRVCTRLSAFKPCRETVWPLLVVRRICINYCEQIRVFKAGVRLNTLAWNNEIGLWCYFVGCVPE